MNFRRLTNEGSMTVTHVRLKLNAESSMSTTFNGAVPTQSEYHGTDETIKECHRITRNATTRRTKRKSWLNTSYVGKQVGVNDWSSLWYRSYASIPFTGFAVGVRLVPVERTTG